MSAASHILVTGAAGFIGSTLVDRLLAEGRRVVGLDSFDPFYAEGLKRANLAGALGSDAFELVEGDIRDVEEVEAIFERGCGGERFDAVVHLAALAGVRPSLERPVAYADVNVNGTSVLLDAAVRHGNPNFVFASSSSVYGERTDGPFKETDRVDRPISPYAATKKACELVAHTFHSAYGLPVSCVRFFTAYGPRQRPDLAVRKFAERMRKGESIPVYGDGTAQRDFTYIDDVVDGVVARYGCARRLGHLQFRRRSHRDGARDDRLPRARTRRPARDRLAGTPDGRRAEDVGRHHARTRGARLRPPDAVRGGRREVRALARGAGMSDVALVTGGAGFIGSHLVAHLLDEGLEVRVLDDLSRGRLENLTAAGAGGCEFVEASVADDAAVHGAAKGARWIFHLAAVPSVVESVAQPVRTNAINVEGTLHVLDAARACNVERVVFAASCAAYGDDPELPKREDMRTRPTSPYALQKIASEQYCALYGELYGLEAVAVRFFNVFGPRQDPYSDYAAVVPRFALAAVRGESVRVYGDGEQTRDFVYVADVARACWLAAGASGVSGEVLNIARGEATSVNELVAAVGECVGREIEVERHPERAGEVRHSVADVARAKNKLGFEAEIGLEEGLRRTVESFDLKAEEEAASLAAPHGDAGQGENAQ